MNIIDAIKELYPQLNTGDYIAEFPDDMDAARNFAEGVRNQLKDLGVSQDETWDIVEQRNTNVYIRVWAVDIPDLSNIENEKEEVTSEECLPEGTIHDDTPPF